MTLTHTPRWTVVVLDSQSLRFTAHGTLKGLAHAQSVAASWNRHFRQVGMLHVSAYATQLQPATVQVRDAAWTPR